MDLNTSLTIASFAAVAIIVAVMLIKARSGKVVFEENQLNTLPKIIDHVKMRLVELDKDEYDLTLSPSEFERAYRRKARTREALSNCIHGIESSKIIVIDLIRNILVEDIEPNVVTSILKLDEQLLPPAYIQFEIMLYRYKKLYGKNALTKIIEKYGFDVKHKDDNAAYYVTDEDLIKAYVRENITLSIEEQTELLAIIIFQRYKGFGVIDTIREMDIDGINLGTSGALLPQVKQTLESAFRVENSVWIYYNGTQIHLRFLSLETEDELRRVVLSLIRYGSKGSLTQNVGRVVSTAPDKARITALCPPAAECWAVFVRKFGFSGKTPEELIIKPYTVNGELVIKMLKFLMKGMVTCAVTGPMGTGKTTLMTSMISYIAPEFSIRTLEMAFELYLRNLYPGRNILAVQETPHVPASVLQDTIKKTDAVVSIVGEVATDDVVAPMIQIGQVASRFTLLSHHANTSKDLVMSLRNSLVNASGFSSMETAERQVTDVIKVDIHLNVTADGKRYVERVTEITALPPGMPYPILIPGDTDSMNMITKEYYERITDRTSFKTRDIIKYNLQTHTYETAEWFSDKLSSYMADCMEVEHRDEFKAFKSECWGEAE